MTGRLYDTARWHRVRKRQLAREPCCRVCAEAGRDTLAREVDHITPLSRGGAPYDRANLQSLCTQHHSYKTSAFDMLGKPWFQWQLRGCNADGSPRDPANPWYDKESPPTGGSVTTTQSATTASGIQEDTY